MPNTPGPFAPDVILPVTGLLRQPDRLRGRPRMRDVPIVNFIGSLHMVTVHQLLERFYRQRGIAVSAGYRLIGELEEAGLIQVDRLHPHLGRRSRCIVSLTEAGRRTADPTWLEPVGRPTNVSEHQAYCLQYAEMRLVRECEKWDVIPSADAWGALQAWAKHAFAVPGLSDTEKIMRGFFQRDRVIAMPCDLLLRRDHSEVRIVLAGVAGRSVAKVLAMMPLDILKLMRSVETLPKRSAAIRFEVVATSDRQFTKAVKAIARWSKVHRLNAQWSSTPSYLYRTNPRLKPRQRVNLYAKANPPDPWFLYFVPNRRRFLVDA